MLRSREEAELLDLVAQMAIQAKPAFLERLDKVLVDTTNAGILHPEDGGSFVCKLALRSHTWSDGKRLVWPITEHITAGGGKVNDAVCHGLQFHKLRCLLDEYADSDANPAVDGLCSGSAFTDRLGTQLCRAAASLADRTAEASAEQWLSS